MKTLIATTIDALTTFVGVYLAIFLFSLTKGKKIYTIWLKMLHLHANYYASLEGRESEDILSEADEIFEDQENDQEEPADESEEEPGRKFE